MNISAWGKDSSLSGNLHKEDIIAVFKTKG